MVAWLGREPGLNEITLGTPSTCACSRPAIASSVMNGRSNHCGACLGAVDKDWQHAATAGRARSRVSQRHGRSRVTDARPSLDGPRTPGGPRPGPLVAAGACRRSAVRCRGRAEPDDSGSDGHVAGERFTSWRSEVSGRATLEFRVTLHAGRNVIEFVALDAPND